MFSELLEIERKRCRKKHDPNVMEPNTIELTNAATLPDIYTLNGGVKSSKVISAILKPQILYY